MVFVFICAYGGYVSAGQKKLTTVVHGRKDLLRVNIKFFRSEALKIACKDQSNGVTTFIEVLLNQELGEPFRRDAMKKPVSVAGIDPADMVPQKAS